MTQNAKLAKQLVVNERDNRQTIVVPADRYHEFMEQYQAVTDQNGVSNFVPVRRSHPQITTCNMDESPLL